MKSRWRSLFHLDTSFDEMFWVSVIVIALYVVQIAVDGAIH